MITLRRSVLSTNIRRIKSSSSRHLSYNSSSLIRKRTLISSESVIRKNNLNNIVPTIRIPRSRFTCHQIIFRNNSTSAGLEAKYPLVVFIGSTSKEVTKPKLPPLVPIKYYNKDSLTQSELSHLQWMLKKDLLKQDIFLIGPPGPFRRNLALAFAELCSREVEYISLSRDTTESDMKQRREVIQKTAQYIDQAAVRAAIEGRLLIVEGIEKAERNVLPLLNNLLENREMHLEDGRHLIAHERYDKLLKDHTSETLENWKLVRVHPDFRVLALGLPVPNFKGNPLDPPLRSRFQGRSIVPISTAEMLKKLEMIAPNVPKEKLESLNNFAYSVVWSNDPDFKKSEENPWSISLPHFPLENLYDAAALLNKYPDTPLHRVLIRIYPYELFLEKEDGEIPALDSTLEKFGFGKADKSIWKSFFRTSSQLEPSTMSNYTQIESQEVTVKEMMQSHSIRRDICIVGERGSGKTTLIKRFAELTGYKIEPIVIYKDMTGRDLLQQRSTKSDGDTIWVNSPLVNAALEGKLAVLDGIDQVHSSTLAVIFRLVQDRELQLNDGRLIRSDRYDEIKEKFGYTDKELNEKLGIFRIHPDFYIAATSSVPSKSSATSSSTSGSSTNVLNKNKKMWLTPEMLSLFFYHRLPDMNFEEEMDVIVSQGSNKNLSDEMKGIISVARELRETNDSSKKSLASSLSTRQLIRIAKRRELFGSNDQEFGPFEELSRACLSRFLPQLNREELDSLMKKHNIHPRVRSSGVVRKVRFEDTSDGKYLHIGSTKAPVWPENEFKSKVPHLLFYDIQQHLKALEELLKDYLMGEHLLLVGNQGVGKNKLVDQLLFLLNRPREYIQLHRDTTVQALTLQQKVLDGVVVYEDSPLVRAARNGHVIIIDEADKAPTHVTCILKTLAESGEMILSDGRRIIPQSLIDKHYSKGAFVPEKIIPLHPNFRMFVLANRPGFPFLGNDFYSALGDLFSVHAIDNPSFESEMELLKQYGPNIEHEYLTRIAKAFGELRNLADEGTISYPYSTREAVNIVKHLEKYPRDSLSEAIDNVFDFDVYNNELRQTIRETLRKYKLEPTEGILLRNNRSSSENGNIDVNVIPLEDIEKMAEQKRKEMTQMTPILDSKRIVKESDFQAPKIGKFDASNAPHVGGNTWAGGSGGTGTAGLGGAGGPFRLDSGNTVFQISESAKLSVPPEVRKMARELAQKAFDERLKEIKMSKYEGNVYEQYVAPIRPQIQALRVILSSLQAKAKERKWVKNQTSGDIDDSKIIESVIGEKNIYKLRKDEDPEPGDPQEKPKRLKLVVDCSGSMYRFNGYDRRMDRMLECALLVMESFQGFDDIFKYEIVCHSGDDYRLYLVDKDPPKDNKARIDIMKMMHLHSQFCSSGDNTLEATEDAIKTAGNEADDYDENFVIVLSDANLERYGIPAKELSRILSINPEVKAFAIFIGSLGDQAERLAQRLPPGRGIVCMDTTKLPQILQRIFTQNLLT